jgi:2-polyprenyl-3-methyl-5-hydroxy-6-metoxy-1,4-benzoquinol methylase
MGRRFRAAATPARDRNRRPTQDVRNLNDRHVTDTRLAAAWTELIAPRRGDVRVELIEEAAQFLGITIDEAWARLHGAGDRFRSEWNEVVTDPTDSLSLTSFYNRSDTELFELIEWHATDPIHYRTLILRDFALNRPGRDYLDYGSGIGNDAIVFGQAGYTVTLADVSDCLLAFAAWRCRRRGFQIRQIDLKRDVPDVSGYDVIACFDVLEHIPAPLDVVRRLHAALRNGGLIAIHAPFGEDPEHPMHVVHRDVVTPRMRSLGFQPVDCAFPPSVRAPQIYEKRDIPALDRAAYYVYDRYLGHPVGAWLAGIYRRHLKRSPAEGWAPVEPR